MANRKLKKLPKKPKAGASVKAMENYLDRVADIKKENEAIVKENAHAEKLRKQIAAISGTSVRPSKSSARHTPRRKRQVSGAKKSVKKKSAGRKSARRHR